MCDKLLNLKNTEFQIAELLSKDVKSAKELQNSLKKDKATIYRNLKSLIEKEVIREIKNSDGISFYEINCRIHNPIHPHFECKVCKKITCLKSLTSEDTLSLSNYTDNFIEEIEIKIKGICKNCKGIE